MLLITIHSLHCTYTVLLIQGHCVGESARKETEDF